MSEPIYNLVFRGEVLEGQHRAVVAKRLAALLKLDPGKAGALFSGKAIVLKRNAPKAVAARYQAAFRKAGARLRVMAAEGVEAANPAAARSSKAEAVASGRKARAEEPVDVLDTRKRSLAERLASEAATRPRADTPGAVPPREVPAGRASAAPSFPARAQAHIAAPPPNAGEHLSVASASGDLIREDERPRIEAVEVDVSHLSVAAAESGSLAGLAAAPPAPVPDTSGISLAEVGSDIGAVSEPVTASVAAPDIGLAEAGADLETLPTPPPPPVADVNFGVAALGADLDPSDKPAPPPAPDVSHISMAAERANFAVSD